METRKVYQPEITHSKKQVGWAENRKQLAEKELDEDEQLLEQIKKFDDWQNLPLPQHWYEKFNIPKPEAQGVGEYLKANLWMKRMTEGGKSIKIIKEPQEWAATTPRGFLETAPLEFKVVQTKGNFSDENPVLTRELSSLPAKIEEETTKEE